MSTTPIPITVGPDGKFRGGIRVETAGTGSEVIGKAFVTYGPTWGGARFTITVLDGAGNVVEQKIRDTYVANNAEGPVYTVPGKGRAITVEGQGESGQTLPLVNLLCTPA